MTVTTYTTQANLLVAQLEVLLAALQVLVGALQGKLRTVSGTLYSLLLIQTGTADRPAISLSFISLLSTVTARERVRSVSNRCQRIIDRYQRMIEDLITSLEEFHIGVVAVLFGSIISLTMSSIGSLLVVGGTGWLLKDLTSYIPTEKVSGADYEEAPTVDDKPESDDEVRIQGPEDRILKVIQKHDCQVHQKHIVAEMDLSEPSVSRHLSSLESKGEIERICLGRENVVYLSGHEPPATQTLEVERSRAT